MKNADPALIILVWIACVIAGTFIGRTLSTLYYRWENRRGWKWLQKSLEEHQKRKDSIPIYKPTKINKSKSR